MSGQAAPKLWLSDPISKLTDRVELKLTETPLYQYPVIVCGRHALCIALQTESITIPRLKAAILRDRQATRANIITMIQSRRLITQACQNAIDNLPPLTDTSNKDEIKRNRAIRAGETARLTGYDVAIILMHAIVTNQRQYWDRIEPLLRNPGKDNVLALWEHYTGQPLVGGKEDASPLILD